MAANQVFKFVDTLSLPVPEGTKSGDAVILNADEGWVGVAETDAGPAAGTPVTGDTEYAGGNINSYASVTLKGAYRLNVTGALNPADPVYITSAGALTATKGTNVRFGFSLTTKGAGEGPATVLIAGAPAAVDAG